MKISDRKKKILQIVVDEYINTAVPVSSKTITEKHLTDVSSATVRNELASLEELGFLTQFHTSGGRIPSPLAYRFYIEELMQKNALSESDLDYITTVFTAQANDVEQIIRSVTHVISELTDYTSVAMSPHGAGEIINNIALVDCGNGEALLLIITGVRILRDSIINVPEGMTRAELDNASAIINKLFVGKSLNNVLELETELIGEFEQYKQIFYDVMSALKSYSKAREKDIVLSGEDKIFNYPEYEDVDNVKNFLSVISSKERLATLMAGGNDQIQISVKIGAEDSSGNVPTNCSLVTATYSVGGKNIGTYGVIGPTRMDYPKVISVLENVGRALEALINNKGENEDGNK